MTLKYNQGHGKWYEWVKLNNYYHHAKFDLHHTYSVQENHNVKVFATYGHLAGRAARPPASQTLIIIIKTLFFHLSPKWQSTHDHHAVCWPVLLGSSLASASGAVRTCQAQGSDFVDPAPGLAYAHLLSGQCWSCGWGQWGPYELSGAAHTHTHTPMKTHTQTCIHTCNRYMHTCRCTHIHTHLHTNTDTYTQRANDPPVQGNDLFGIKYSTATLSLIVSETFQTKSSP